MIATDTIEKIAVPAAVVRTTESAAMIGARLDRLGASREIWVLVVLISLGGFFEFYELFSPAYITPGIIRSGLLTATTTEFFGMSGVAAFIASAFAGLLIGTLVFSGVADKFGRRRVFTYAMLLYSASAAVMAFQHTAGGINFWRFMTGLGLGVELVTIDAYISELVPKQMRGRAFALGTAIFFASIPVEAFLAWQLVPLDPFGFAGWRWVVLIGASGALFVWVIRLRLPESPRWLAAHGQGALADQVVTGLEQRAERTTGRPLPAPEVTDSSTPDQGHFRDIWSSKYRSRTIMLCLFNIVQPIGLYGFANWVPTFLIKQGITVTASLGYAFGIALVLPAGCLVALLFADRFERKWQLVWAALILAGTGLLFAETRNPVVIVLSGAVIQFVSGVLSYNFHAYQTELYPTGIRARAAGFVYSWSRLSAMFSGFLIAFALGHYGVSGALTVIAASMVMVALVIGILGPRTSGRSLEALSS